MKGFFIPLLTTIKTNKFLLIPAMFTAVALGSFSANFSPSPVFKLFAPIVWIPMGLLVLWVMTRDPNWKARTFPLWRKIISYAIIGCFTCYLAKFIFVNGFGDLITRIFGTPFQESSVIVKKTSARRFCLHSLKVDKFQTASGDICLDIVWGVLSNNYKEIWETSKTGDDIILIGKKTSFGSSITTIQSEKNYKPVVTPENTPVHQMAHPVKDTNFQLAAGPAQKLAGQPYDRWTNE